MICTGLSLYGQQAVMLEDVSSNAAQYTLISLREGGLLLRNAGGNSSSVALMRLNENQEPIWFRAISDYSIEEQLFHYSVDEEYIYFFFNRRRGFGGPEFSGRRRSTIGGDEQLLNTVPEQANQNGLSIRYVNLSTGEMYQRFFSGNNPITFYKADVSWPNVMAYGEAFDRKILFSGNFLNGERNLISLNLDLYEDVSVLSALPKSGGRFAVGLSNRVDELFVFDVDGLRPRLAPGNNFSLFLQAEGIHAPSTDNEERYFILKGSHKGEEGMFMMDLSEGLNPKLIPEARTAKINDKALAKGRVQTTRIIKTENRYFLTQVHKKPFKTWFQNMDPFWDYSSIMIQMMRRSPGNQESTTSSKTGFFEAIRDQLGPSPIPIIASEQPGMMLREEMGRELRGNTGPGFGPRFAGSFNPVLRLLSRKKVYSPSRQDGFSVLELNLDGTLVEGTYFKQKKEKISSYRERVAINYHDGDVQILAAEKEGIMLYDWYGGTKKMIVDHQSYPNKDARGFERLAFIGKKPLSVWADFFNLGKRQGFSTTSTHKVEFYLHFSK